MTHVLFVDILGLPALRAAMGEAVTARAVAELRDRLPALLAGVLGHFVSAAVLPSRHPGRWCAALGCGTEAAEESVMVTRLAAQRLVHDLVAEIFGSATGAWAHVVADIQPFDGSPDQVDVWLDAHRPHAVRLADEVSRLRGEVAALLEDGGLRTLVQPIVDFASGRLVGYEALSRGPLGHALERADLLFDAAARTGLSPALERACARRAVAWLERLPASLWLSVNASVPLLLEADMRAALARPGVVVEITEHLPIDEAPGLLPALAELRRGGARVALDDTGCGFADVAAAGILRPDIVKLCITVIRGAGRDPAVLAELRNTVAEFRALGAQVLAEGVEDEAQAEALRPMGIELAQGWLFGRPVAVADAL